MSRVVVAEKVAEAGLEILRKAGHEVVLLDGAPRERLLEELKEADALLVRSATKVDRAYTYEVEQKTELRPAEQPVLPEKSLRTRHGRCRYHSASRYSDFFSN